MTDSKERFSLADEIDARDLWNEARRRAATPDGSSRAADWPPASDGGSRSVVAFAVFAAAVRRGTSHIRTRPSVRTRPRRWSTSLRAPGGMSELPAPPEVRSGAATA